ncbi:MAG TPA: hypothetical protein VMG08_02295 [Allosphingosinicella sp.]|nr:hypothetical protein [Allosphingosinicella sp.]
MSAWGETLARIALPLTVVAFLVWLSFRRRQPTVAADGPSDEPYRIYTCAFDLELRAHEVPVYLPTASPDARLGYLDGAPAWDRAATGMEALLTSKRAAFDLDAERAKLRAVATDPGGIFVTLLVDQSGSMKGAPMTSAAVTATLLADLLYSLGVCTEVLGFSTAGWRGGHARAQWLDAGRPARPGRLCALMHVIYKSADEAGLGGDARRVMVHPDLLRENLDGEAILWARDRLLARAERRKLLIVISDGAPVDDSTLQSNGPTYLFRHLKTVLEDAEADPRVTIGGVGIACDVGALYRLASTALTPDDLTDAVLRLLPQMLAAGAEPDPGPLSPPASSP